MLPRAGASAKQGFTLLELSVVIAVISLIIFLIGGVFSKIAAWRSSASTASCQKNLRLITTAIMQYSRDNQDEIPYASVIYTTKNHWSWDDLLSKYLPNPVADAQLDLPFSHENQKLLLCPEDEPSLVSAKFKGEAHRRSYAMVEALRNKGNWPPSSNSQSGAGLKILPADIIFRPKEVWPPISSPISGTTPAFAIEMIRKPQATIAITERVHPKNVIGGAEESTIPNSTEHIHSNVKLDPRDFHNDLFNYAMFDGSVSLLSPLQTLSKSNAAPAYQSGMWTIIPTD